MKLEYIHPHHVVSVWPRVEKMLADAIAFSGGEYSADQLKVLLVTGHQVLLIALDGDDVAGAVTVASECYPNVTVAFITAIGGRLISDADLFSQLKAWCLQRGYTRIRGLARESVARLWRQKFKFYEISRVVEVSL
ncbi:MAG: hypothetical protein IPO08_23435 [Xanthomonadales bacterium]|nr:hypothetical protein [Xanthomonadales bacterium]